MNEKTIVLVSTFDTKGQECLYVKNLISENNFLVTTIDIGTGARGKLIFKPDHPREEVVKNAKSSMDEVLELGKVGKEMGIMDIMTRGAIKICQQLRQSGKLDGIISLGGTMGTSLGTTIMKALPFGIPKVMLSTIAASDMRSFVGTSDIVMVPSVADIIGLNNITKTVLTRAAGAVMGMASTGEVKTSDTPLIGTTTLGGTQICVDRVAKHLSKKGYEFVVFHANGVGGKSMEELIDQGIIKGVFDASPNEVVDHMYGAWSDAGPTRLETAGLKGVPQLVAAGNLDHIIFNSADSIPERFKNHYVHRHGPSIFTLRTQKKDMEEIGKVVAEKLNKAKGPTAVLLSLKGISVLDQVDKDFVDNEANFALFETLKKNLKPEIEVKVMDAHINDESFADEAAEMMYRLMGGKDA
jgi:uncharacterized protein (UPF0261 family)